MMASFPSLFIVGVSELEKRKSSSEVMVFFECLAGQAFCNNGYGPAITYRANSLPVCACVCPMGEVGPQCQSHSQGSTGTVKTYSTQ